jgi:hypothetical protein
VGGVGACLWGFTWCVEAAAGVLLQGYLMKQKCAV